MDKNLGFRKAYKMTGTPGFAGGPGDKIDEGSSGSHRDNNWKIGAKQGGLSTGKKVGPDKNLNQISSGNHY